MFEPKNEKGVEYLFSVHHKELGFEKIISFNSFPDIVALRNGKIVKIELEYRLECFNKHYLVAKQYSRYSNYIWIKIDKRWEAFNILTKKYLDIGRGHLDEKNIFTTNESGYDLVYKTLKDKVDIVIYWKKSHGFKIDDDIEFIDLGKLLIEKKHV